jgi:hypothetical protein
LTSIVEIFQKNPSGELLVYTSRNKDASNRAAVSHRRIAAERGISEAIQRTNGETCQASRGGAAPDLSARSPETPAIIDTPLLLT